MLQLFNTGDIFLTGSTQQNESKPASASRRRRKHLQPTGGATNTKRAQTASSEEYVSSENDSNYSDDSLMCATEMADDTGLLTHMEDPTVEEIRSVTLSLEGMTSALMLGDGDGDPDLPSTEEVTQLQDEDQRREIGETKTGHDEGNVSSPQDSSCVTQDKAGQDMSADTAEQTQEDSSTVEAEGTTELDSGQVVLVLGMTSKKTRQLVVSEVDVWHSATDHPDRQDQMHLSVARPSEYAALIGKMAASGQLRDSPISKRRQLEEFRVSEADVWSTVQPKGEPDGKEDVDMCDHVEGGGKSVKMHTGSVDSTAVTQRKNNGLTPSEKGVFMEHNEPVSLSHDTDPPQGQAGLPDHVCSKVLPENFVYPETTYSLLPGAADEEEDHTTSTAEAHLSTDHTTPSTAETEVSTDHTKPSTAETEVSTDHTTPSTAETEVSTYHTTPSTAETEVSTDHTTPSTAETEVSTNDTTPSTAETEVSADHTTPSTAETEVSTDHAKPSTAQTEVSTDHTKPSTAETEVSTDHTTPSTAETEVSTDHTKPSTAETEVSTDHNTPSTAETEVSTDHTTPSTADTEVSTDHNTPSTAETEVSTDHTTADTEVPTYHNTPSTAETEVSTDHTKPSTADTEVPTDHNTPSTAETEVSTDHTTADTEVSTDHTTPSTAETEVSTDHTTPSTAETEVSTDHTTPFTAETEVSTDHTKPSTAETEVSTDHNTPSTAETEVSTDHTTADTEVSTDHTTPSTAETEVSTGHTTPSTAETEVSTDHTTPSTAETEVSTDHTIPSTADTEVSTDHTTPSTAETDVSTDHTTPSTAETEVSTDHTTPSTAETEVSTYHNMPSTAETEVSTDHNTPSTAETEVSTGHTTPSTADTEVPTDHNTPSTAETEVSTDHTKPSTADTEVPTDHNTPSTAETEVSTDHTTADTEVSTDHTTPSTAETEVSTDHTTPSTAETEVSTDHTTPFTAETEVSTDHTKPSTAETEVSTDHNTPSTAETEVSTDHTTADTADTEVSTDHTTPSTAETEVSTGHTTPSTAETEVSTDHTTPSTAETEVSTDHTIPSTADTEVSTDHTTPSTAETEVSTDHTTPSTAETEVSTDHTTPSTAETEVSTDHNMPSTAETEVSTDHNTPSTAETEVSTGHATPSTAETEGSTDHTRPSTAEIYLATDHTITEAELSTDHTTTEAELPTDHTTTEAELSTDHITTEAEQSTDHITTEAELSMDHTTTEAELSTDNTTMEADLSTDHTTTEAELSTAATELSLDHTTSSTAQSELSTDCTLSSIAAAKLSTGTTELPPDHTTAVTELSTDQSTPSTAVTELSAEMTEVASDHTTTAAELLDKIPEDDKTSCFSEILPQGIMEDNTATLLQASETEEATHDKLGSSQLQASETEEATHDKLGSSQLQASETEEATHDKLGSSQLQASETEEATHDKLGSSQLQASGTEKAATRDDHGTSQLSCVLSQQSTEPAGQTNTAPGKSAKTGESRDNRDSGYYSLPRGALFDSQYASDGNTMTSPSESEEDTLHRSGDKETSPCGDTETGVTGGDTALGQVQDAQTDTATDVTAPDVQPRKELSDRDICESTSLLGQSNDADQLLSSAVGVYTMGADKFSSSVADVKSTDADKFPSSTADAESTDAESTDADKFPLPAADVESTDADKFPSSPADVESTDADKFPSSAADVESTDADSFPSSAEVVESTDADKFPSSAEVVESTDADKFPSSAADVESADADKFPSSAADVESTDADKFPSSAEVVESIDADKFPSSAADVESADADKFPSSAADVESTDTDKYPSSAADVESTDADKFPSSAADVESTDANKFPSSAADIESTDADKFPSSAADAESTDADKFPSSAANVESTDADKFPSSAEDVESTYADKFPSSAADVESIDANSQFTTSGNIKSLVELNGTNLAAPSALEIVADIDSDEFSDNAKNCHPQLTTDSVLLAGTETADKDNCVLVNGSLPAGVMREDTAAPSAPDRGSGGHSTETIGPNKSLVSAETTADTISDKQLSLEMAGPEVTTDTAGTGGKQEDRADQRHSSAEALVAHSPETKAVDRMPATTVIHQNTTIPEPGAARPSDNSQTKRSATDPALAGGPSSESRSGVTPAVGHFKAGPCTLPVTSGSNIWELNSASASPAGQTVETCGQSNVLLTQQSVDGTEPVQTDTAGAGFVEAPTALYQAVYGDSDSAKEPLVDYTSVCKQPSDVQGHREVCDSRLDYSNGQLRQQQVVVAGVCDQQHDLHAGEQGGHDRSVTVGSVVADLAATRASGVGTASVCPTPSDRNIPDNCLVTPVTDASDLCIGADGSQSETVLDLQETFAAETSVPEQNRQVIVTPDRQHPRDTDVDTDSVTTCNRHPEFIASAKHSHGVTGECLVDNVRHLEDTQLELYSINGDPHSNNALCGAAITSKTAPVLEDVSATSRRMADQLVAAADTTEEGKLPSGVDKNEAEDTSTCITVTLQSEVAQQNTRHTEGRTDSPESDQSTDNLVKSRLHLQPARDDDEALFEGSSDVTPQSPADTDAGSYELVHFKAPDLARRVHRCIGEDDVKKMEGLEKSSIIFMMDKDFDELIQNVVQEGWEYATVADTGGQSVNGVSHGEDEDVSQHATDGTDESGEDIGTKPLKSSNTAMTRKESNLSMLVNVGEDQDEVMSDDEGDDSDRDVIADMVDRRDITLVGDVVLNQVPEWGTDSANPSMIPNIDEEPEELVEEDIEFMHGISTEDSQDEDEDDDSGDDESDDDDDDEPGTDLMPPVSKSDPHQRGTIQGRPEDKRSSPTASGGPTSPAGKKMDTEVSISFDDGYCTMMLMTPDVNDASVTVTVHDTSNEDTEHDVSFSALGDVEECGVLRERTGSVPVDTSSRHGDGPEDYTQRDFAPVSMSSPHGQDMSRPITIVTPSGGQDPLRRDHGSFMLLQYKEPEGGVVRETEGVVQPLELSRILHMINSDFEELANVVAREGWEYATITSTGDASDEATLADASTSEPTEILADDQPDITSLPRKASSLSMFVNTGDDDDQQMSDDDTEVERLYRGHDRLRLLQPDGSRSRNTSVLSTLGDEPEDINEDEIEFMRQELPRRANFTIGMAECLANNDIDEASGTATEAPADGQLPNDAAASVSNTISGQQQPGGYSETKQANVTPNGNVPCMKSTGDRGKKSAVLVDTKVIGFDIQPDRPDTSSRQPELQHDVLFETQSRYNYFRDNGAPLLTADVQILGVQPPMATPQPRQTPARQEPILVEHPTAPCQQHLKFSSLDIEIKPLKSRRLVCGEDQGRSESGEEAASVDANEVVEHAPRSEGVILDPRRRVNIAGTSASGGAYLGMAGLNMTSPSDMTQQVGPDGVSEGFAEKTPGKPVCADSTESVDTVIEAAADMDRDTVNKIAAAAAQLSDEHVAEAIKSRLAWMHLFGMPTDDVCLLPKRYQTVETQTSFDSSSSSSSSGSNLDTSDVMDDFQARLLISQFIEEASEVIPPPDEDESSISSGGSRLQLSPGELDLYSSDTFLSSSSMESIPEDLDQAAEDEAQDLWEAAQCPEVTSSMLESDDENMADTEDNAEQDASNDSITYVFLSHSRSLHEMVLWDDDQGMLRPTSASEPTCAEDTPRSYPYDTDHLGLPLKERSVSLDEVRYLHPDTMSSGQRSVSLDLSKQMLTEDIAPEDIFGGHFDDATESEPEDTAKHHKGTGTTSTSCQVDSGAPDHGEEMSSSQTRATTGYGREVSGTGSLETCEMTLEQSGEIAIRSEVRAAGLQVSSMHITDLVDASLHVEARHPGSYFVNIHKMQRTIETQTYPEMRVIETQTSDDEGKRSKAQKSSEVDPFSPAAMETCDAEVDVLTVDTGVNPSPPGGQSPVLFSRPLEPVDHQAEVDTPPPSRLQDETGKDSTSCLDGVGSQTESSSAPERQLPHRGLDRLVSVHTQSEAWEEAIDEPLPAMKQEVSAEEQVTPSKSDMASGPESGNMTGTQSPTSTSVRGHIKPKTSAGSTEQQTTTEPSTLKTTAPRQLVSIDSKTSQETTELEPCLVETARSTQAPQRPGETGGKTSKMTGEVPSVRLLDATVVTTSLFNVDRTEKAEGDTQKETRSGKAQSSQSHDRPTGAVLSARKTSMRETPVKQRTGKSTILHSKPSHASSVGKTQNVKDKQSHKSTNLRDGNPAAQSKLKPQTSEALQAVQKLKEAVTDTSKGVPSEKTSRGKDSLVDPKKTKVQSDSPKSPKTKRSTDVKNPVPSSATKQGKAVKTKDTPSKTSFPDSRDSEIRQIVKKYQAIKQVIEIAASSLPAASQEKGKVPKPASPIHVTNIRMGDRYTLSPTGKRQMSSRHSPRGSNRTRTVSAGEERKDGKNEDKEGKNEDLTHQKDQAVGTDSTEGYYDDELERLRRERQRILDMLGKDAMPSKLQVELAEAQLNYIIGQTDTLLQALDEPWDSESLMAYTAHDEQLRNISRAYLSKYRTTLEQSRVDIEQRIVELEQNATSVPGRSRARKRHFLEQERRNAVESFKRERHREQVSFEMMKEKLRSRSLSPADGSVSSVRWTLPLPRVKVTQSRSRVMTSSAMTPKQRCDYLVGVRKGIVRSTKDASSPSPSVSSSGSPQVTPRGAMSVLSPPFRSHSAGRAASHTPGLPPSPGFTLYHNNRVRSYSPAPGHRTLLTYTSQALRGGDIPAYNSYTHETVDASSITSSLDEDSMRLLDDYQVTRGRTHSEIERARQVLQAGAGHMSRAPAVHTSTQ